MESERLATVETEVQAIKERLVKVEQIGDAIYEQNTHISNLVIELRHTNELLTDHDSRIETLETDKTKKWDALMSAITTALVGGMIGFFINYLV